MKLNTLAKRLAEKTGTPVLEQVILGEVPIEALPEECMIWSGTRTIPERRRVNFLRRNHDGFLYPINRTESPYGTISYETQRWLAHRLIVKLVRNLQGDFTTESLCGQELCVNPTHWHAKAVVPKVKEDTEELPPEPPEMSDDWTVAEVNEVLETYLDHYNPRSWEDINSAPMLIDVPRGMLKEALLRFNKEHLLC